MARPKRLLIAPAEENSIGYASNVTGDTFVLISNDADDSLAHRVDIRNDSATNHSGKTITLVGTDADGEPLTEVVTGPTAGATVTSTNYFLVLDSATPSATIGADTFDIGWVDEIITPSLALDFYASATATVAIDISGTINTTMQETFQDVLGTIAAGRNLTWSDITNLTGVTADAVESTMAMATGVRLVVNSYATGATIQLDVIQGRS